MLFQATKLVGLSRVRFVGGGGVGGGVNPPNDFLTPESRFELLGGGVDSNPSVSVTC